VSFSPDVKKLLRTVAYLVPLSYEACREGFAHDRSSSCMPDFDRALRPPFLGFECWEQVGIALLVLIAGLVIAAVLIARDSYFESSMITNAEAD
jgi:hypothetical protein